MDFEPSDRFMRRLILRSHFKRTSDGRLALSSGVFKVTSKVMQGVRIASVDHLNAGHDPRFVYDRDCRRAEFEVDENCGVASLAHDEIIASAASVERSPLPGNPQHCDVRFPDGDKKVLERLADACEVDVWPAAVSPVEQVLVH